MEAVLFENAWIYERRVNSKSVWGGNPEREVWTESTLRGNGSWRRANPRTAHQIGRLTKTRRGVKFCCHQPIDGSSPPLCAGSPSRSLSTMSLSVRPTRRLTSRSITRSQSFTGVNTHDKTYRCTSVSWISRDSLDVVVFINTFLGTHFGLKTW